MTVRSIGFSSARAVFTDFGVSGSLAGLPELDSRHEGV